MYNDIDSFDQFVSIIRKRCGNNRLRGLAISTAGFVLSDEGRIVSCKCAPYLEGEVVHRLKKEFPFTKIAVVNDGEAHARALLYPNRNVRFGAVHFALGTSVAFGVIDNNRKIVRTCNGENWDIGDYILKTREKPYEAWYKLGAVGLKELETNLSGDPYYHFGMRAAGLITNLAVVFRPSTIGLSGGIISSHGTQILRGIKKNSERPYYLIQ